MNQRVSFVKASMSNNTKKIHTKVSVKKRINQWDNEIIPDFNHILTHTLIDGAFPMCYGDRFITRRYPVTVDSERIWKIIDTKVINDIFKVRLTANYWRQTGFAMLMDEMFDMKVCRVLKFSDILSKNPPPKSTTGCDWTCKPRTKPMIFPDATHDLPGFNTFFDHNLVDWSVNGQIVASFGHDVIVWNREKDMTMMFNIICPRAVSYCPNGDFLAVGCKSYGFPVIELWDVKSFGQFTIASGKVFNMKHADVRCIEWNKSGSHVICGMQSGTMFVLAVPELNTIQRLRRHNTAITTIKLSPSLRFLASGDANGNVVIYNWDSCEVYLFVRSKRKLNVVFDWHPWNGVDLVISEDMPASVAILHVPSKQIVAFYQRRDKSIIIKSVTFSKLTGELLVSVSKQDIDGCIDFKVLVMASLDRIVDVIKDVDNGARFMMWSPDGTKLATASADETLTIWHFYSATNKFSITPKTTQRQLIPEFGNVFKKWSNIK